MRLNHRYPSALISLVILMFISRLDSEITPQPGLKEMAKADIKQLMTLVRYTGVSITYFEKAFSFKKKTNCFWLHVVFTHVCRSCYLFASSSPFFLFSYHSF